MSSKARDRVETERCYFCPARHGIEVHHIVPQRFRGSDSRENLVAVCETCHKKLEALYDRRFYDALGIDDTGKGRHLHFTCLCCDTPAEAKVRTSHGRTNWFCREHADRVLEGGGTLVEEVSR